MTHEQAFALAADEARRAECGRARCGAVIVAEGGEVIGRGWNGSPGGVPSQRRCERKDELSATFKSDRTCCVHAEWRAILEAVRVNARAVRGATLYFTRVDAAGSLEYSGEPYCTICSKLALEVGLGWFALWHTTGIRLYEVVEYNDRSFSS